MYKIKTDCSDKIVIAVTIEKSKLFNSKPIFRCGATSFRLFCDIKFLIWLRYWSCFRHSDKSAIVLFIFSFKNSYGYGLC